MCEAFCIDLDKKRLEVMEYSGETLKNDMRDFGAKTPLELNQKQFDRRVFLNQDDAEAFIDEYTEILDALSNDDICASRDLPAILYKRRYLVLTLMGLKNFTVRHYKKNWSKGDLINLHDQTFFLTVKINSVTETKDGNYKYEFELP